LEKELVLRYNKAQIEDSLYFLEKRGYLNKHGFVNFTLVAYELTPQAIDVLEKGEFTEEEQRAFEEALFDIKQPGWFGMKFNLGELFRRSKKMLKIRNETK
jgi:DNA-binding PadR family transcriptional regulator